MRMKFKDLYVGQEFTHHLIPQKLMKVENERYRTVYTPDELKGGSVVQPVPTYRERIDPNVPLADTWVSVE